MNDADLLFVAKNACSIHTQAGAYAGEFLAELKRRFDEGKRLGKPYLDYKNFDKLSCDKVDITSRQLRNILNNNPSGKKGRVLKPRPSVKEFEEVKSENKRLKAHVKLVEAANDRATGGSAQPVARYTRQEVEQAKKMRSGTISKLLRRTSRKAKTRSRSLKLP